MFEEFECNGIEMMVYIEYKEIVELNAIASKEMMFVQVAQYRRYQDCLITLPSLVDFLS
eukprot:COSAG02_NODE_1756_length_11052_cov_5.309230_4_plen_59_part_00